MPRTQIGPFLILGVDKDATREVIEAAWAEKVKQARRGQVKTPLEDINWAREMLTNKESRIRCDAVALNIDTTDGTLTKLQRTLSGQTASRDPLQADRHREMAGGIRRRRPRRRPLTKFGSRCRLPEIPRDVPAVRVMLENFVKEPIDPWQVELDA